MTAKLEDWLMPIEKTFALQILTGWKRYEVRKHPLHAPQETRIWLYATARTWKPGTGAILGYMTYGCSEPFTATNERRMALEAASSVNQLAPYLQGKPAWGLRVKTYCRLKEPIEVTFPYMSLVRFPNKPALLRRLELAPKFTERRPRGPDTVIAHTKQMLAKVGNH